jgi:PAS domain S-box-containing protein
LSPGNDKDDLRAAEPADAGRYRALFDALDAGFCIIEMGFAADGRPNDYRFLDFNQAFAEQTGMPDARGRWISELAPGHEPRWFEIYGRVALTGEPVRFESEAAALGRWYDIQAYRADDPALRRVAVLFNDITARKRAESQLTVLNARLEAQVVARTADRDRLWRLSRDPFLISDAEGRWIRASPAWTEILGWTQDELLGRTSEWMEHPDDRQRTRNEIVDLAGGATTLRFQNRFRTQGGDYRWFSWTAVQDAGLLYCVARDVTEERGREEALRDSQDFARLALEAVGGVGVWTYEVATDRFFCDAAISDLYGLDPERGAAGLPRTEFLAHVHPDDVPSLRATMSGGLNRAGDLELEYRIRHPDGSVRWVLSRGHTYFDDQGQPVRRTGVGVEMTRQRELEGQLRQSQKMEAVGQLTGGLAHDFNNLLTGITGSLELLQIRISQGRTAEIGRYVEAAQGAARRAAALTHRLLAFSRRQTLDPSLVDANRLASSMEDLVRRTVGPSITLDMRLEPDLWTVMVDASQLENALLNLCINARDAMPEGGRLTVETVNQALAAGAAREAGVEPGDYVRLSVSDTGSGMTPEVIARAFDPFFTTKPLGQGTGLGLSMIYGFAHQSGGQVIIRSPPGEGVTVSLYLPRGQGVAADEPAAASVSAPEPVVGSATVLVVDDEPTVRMLVVDVLQELGCQALEAADGAEGLKILNAGGRVDLLVTDVGLPGGMNGRQMADAARVRRPGLKVLFITGYAETAAVGGDVMEPDMHVLTKPFAMETLADRIRQIVAS